VLGNNLVSVLIPVRDNGVLTRKFQKINVLLDGYRGFVFLLFIVVLFSSVAESLGLSMVLPLLSGLIGSSELSGRAARFLFIFANFPKQYQVLGLLGVLTVAFIVKNILRVLQTGMAAHLTGSLRREWATKVMNNYLTAQYHAVIARRQGVLINNVVTEPHFASKAIRFMLVIGSKLILSFNLLLVLLFVNYQVTLALSITGGLIFYLTKYKLQNYSSRFGRQCIKLNQKISSCATEGMGGLKQIKALGREESYRLNIFNKFDEYRRIETKFSVLSELPNYLIEILVILLLAGLTIFSQFYLGLSFQDLLPVVAVFLLISQKIINDMAYVLSMRMKVISLLPSMDLVYHVLCDTSDREQVAAGRQIDRLPGDIMLRDVSFSHQPGHLLFSKLTMVISRGKMTAVVGPSGIGKTTVVDLILRFAAPTDGEIVIQGFGDLKDVNLVSWRKLIGYVSQEPYMFNGSIRDNILVGKPDASEEEIVAAAVQANAHEFIMGLPHKYETDVGALGMKLSGGQRQRIAIARALIRNPELLIFDEATSSLDHESERLIQKSIEGLRATKTILVIAHRLSTIEKADRIYQCGVDGRAREVSFSSLLAAAN